MFTVEQQALIVGDQKAARPAGFDSRRRNQPSSVGASVR